MTLRSSCGANMAATPSGVPSPSSAEGEGLLFSVISCSRAGPDSHLGQIDPCVSREPSPMAGGAEYAEGLKPGS